MYIPEHFTIEELIPQYLYNAHHLENNKLWLMFDERLLKTIDRIRERYGPMVANDWKWGGSNNFRGWRPTRCFVGATFSQHKYGRGADLKPTQADPHKIRQDILTDSMCEDFKYITCVEMDISWLHIDCRNHEKDESGILKVYP